MNVSRWLKVVLLVLCAMAVFAPSATCQENKKLDPLKKTWNDAIKKWEKTSAWLFNVPFPEEWDIDYWSKQPIALVPVGAQQLRCTRPYTRAYDDCTISFHVWPGEMGDFFKRSLEAEFDVDEQGKIGSFKVRTEGDPWAKQDQVWQIDRQDGEVAAKYIDRVIATYRQSARKAKDPAEAERMLTIWEKVVRGVIANLPEPPK